MAETVLSQQGDALDFVVWKHYGQQDGRRVEQVLEAPENYGLADKPEILTIATAVVMPDIAEATITPTVKLWD